MKKIFLIIVGVSMLTSLCVAQEQNVYRSPDGHFSFIIPEEWIEYPKDTMDEINARLGQLSEGGVTYETGFHKTGGWEYPDFYLQIKKTGRWTAKDLKRVVDNAKSYNAAEKMEQALNPLDWDLKNAKVNKIIYDEERNIVFLNMGSTNEESGKVLGINAVILSNYGSVSMLFYSLENKFDNDSPYLKEILDSFKFEEGYGY